MSEFSRELQSTAELRLFNIKRFKITIMAHMK